jgi:hypothetical protein
VNSNKTYRETAAICKISFGIITVFITNLLLILSAYGGAMAPCETPRVFSGAAVNALILPYRYTGPKRFYPLSETGDKLSRILQLEVLFSMLKHGDVGSTVLMGKPGKCNVKSVLKKLMGHPIGYPGELLPGRALVILSGRIFEDGDDIYLQSYLQFFRRGEIESIRIELKGPGGQHIEFTGHLPENEITFNPRLISHEDIQSIQNEFIQSTIIRPNPDLSSDGTSLAEWPAWSRFSYWVTDVDNNWIHIQSQIDKTHGWVRARIDPWSWPLRRKMPELAFVDAVVGYLRYQVGHHEKDVEPAHPNTIQMIDDALKAYKEYAGSRLAQLPMAVGNSMLGMIKISSAQTEAERNKAMESVIPLFVRARKLVPYSADVRNLEAISRIYIDTRKKLEKENSLKIVKKLLDAIAVEPDNESVLVNLTHLYKYFVLQPKMNPYPKIELQRRIDEIQGIRASLHN